MIVKFSWHLLVSTIRKFWHWKFCCTNFLVLLMKLLGISPDWEVKLTLNRYQPTNHDWEIEEADVICFCPPRCSFLNTLLIYEEEGENFCVCISTIVNLTVILTVITFQFYVSLIKLFYLETLYQTTSFNVWRTEEATTRTPKMGDD